MKDWKERARELSETDISPINAHREVTKEGLQVNYNTFRRFFNQTKKELEGETEYKPKWTKQDNGYLIRYGKNGKHCVFITSHDLEEAFSLYCIAGLTLNEVSLQANLTRREFYAIKTAFDITKTSMPFTPEQINEYSPEELAEKYRLKKLQYALKKFEQNKNKDIEKRIKEMDNAAFWYQEIAKQVNQVDPKPYQILKRTYAIEELYKANITDIHGGLTVDNYFNTYNIDIMHKRFKMTAEAIINLVPNKVIYISDLGDTVHGIIHGSTQKYSAWVPTAVTEVIRGYGNLFVTLTKEGFEIYFTKVNGSHESIEKVKDSRTEEESFGNLIYDMLQWKFGQFSNIHFIDKIKGLNAAIFKMFGYGILNIHGDNNGLTKIKEADRLFKEYNIREINAGHLHHLKVEEFNGLTVYYNEPFCGTDQYAGNKLLSSEYGTRLVQYTPEGRGIERLIRYE